MLHGQGPAEHHSTRRSGRAVLVDPDCRPHPGMDAALEAMKPRRQVRDCERASWRDCRRIALTRREHAFGCRRQPDAQRQNAAATELLDVREGVSPPAIVRHPNAHALAHGEIRRLVPPCRMSDESRRQRRAQQSAELRVRDISLANQASTRRRPCRIGRIAGIENRDARRLESLVRTEGERRRRTVVGSCRVTGGNAHGIVCATRLPATRLTTDLPAPRADSSGSRCRP